MNYLNGMFTEALNLLLGGEEIKHVSVKAQRLARDRMMAAAGWGHSLTLWLVDCLNLLNYDLSPSILN